MGDVRGMDILEFQKLIQVFNFFAIQNGGTIDKLKAIKLLFFADRYHVRKYGRPVVWSTYFAMENGPVSSEARDLLEQNENYLSDQRLKQSKLFLQKKGEYDFQSIKEVDKNVFSETDIEALNFAWDNFKSFDQHTLIDITHAYPEWKQYKKLFETGQTKREPIDFRDFFRNDSDKEFLLKKLGKDPFENIESPAAEIELEEEEEARQIVDC